MYFRCKYYLTLILLLTLFSSSTIGQQLPQENYSVRQLDSMHMKQLNRMKSFQNAKGLTGPPHNLKSSFRGANILSTNLNTSVSPTCFDTSARFFLYNDTIFFYAEKSIILQDRSILTVGQCVQNKYPYSEMGGFLIKSDTLGNIIWAKRHDTVNNVLYDYINYYKVIELKDHSIAIAGSTKNSETDNDDVIVTRIDQLGNIIWQKTYRSVLWGHGDGSTDFYYIQQMRQDEYAGDIYITGPHWSNGRSIMRLDETNGNIVWSRYYDLFEATFDEPFGLDIRQNYLVSIGGFGSSIVTGGISAYRINKQTGDTISTRVYSLVDPNDIWRGFLAKDELTRLNNGHYMFGGGCYGYSRFQWDGITPLNYASVMELDENLNIVNAYDFEGLVQTNSYNTCVTVYPDGTGTLAMLHVISNYTGDMYYTQFANGQIMRQTRKRYSNEGMPVQPPFLKLPTGGLLNVKLLGDSTYHLNKVEYLTLHTSDTSSSCLGVDDYSTSVRYFRYKNSNYAMTNIGSTDFVLSRQKNIASFNFPLKFLPGCRQVSICDSLGIKISQDSICTSMPVTLTVRKNPECGAFPLFEYDTSKVESFVRTNDSMYSVKFKAAWQGFIVGGVQGCSMIKDSVHIVVSDAPASLDLGPDKSLCPGNTILLNAKSGFVRYLWQDGSTDSTFLVTSPGTYFVKATDACGVIRSDTMVVTSAPPIPFNIGPDRNKCNNDTIQINAPAGFLNYTWSNNYNISSLTGPNVVVNPLIDTSYYVKAEKTPGCFAFDTVHIFVNHSLAIYLGADTSLCQGHQLVLDAGNGFSTYLWNTNANSETIIVNTTGNYSVIGTSVDGCKSYDTLNLLNVFANPVVNLDKTATICTDQTRMLDAGNYASFLWQDNSTARRFAVNGPGTYYVQVWDVHGCTSSDTSIIATVLPNPSAFLPPDTSLCAYAKFTIRPLNSYAQYAWSTNATSSNITIENAGTYWLRVMDDRSCIGIDSIIISPKQCMLRLYVPNGFSPRKNGHNDLFRPLLFGNVQKFEFSVYNRWGQLIFHTTELTKGWDGTLNGQELPSSTFIWICKYQLEGEKAKMEKGAVVLVR